IYGSFWGYLSGWMQTIVYGPAIIGTLGLYFSSLMINFFYLDKVWNLPIAIGSLIAALIFVPIGALQAGEALWHWSVIPLGLAVAILSTALPYSLEMIALTRLPTRTFGTLMSMEPALAAVSGMIFLGETLTPIQLLALGAIIAASMGSTLTVRKESKIKELDIN
ncbi:EamA family transporter, partial [Escherichia sp. R-CC3]